MLRKMIAPCLVAFTIAVVPVMAQTPAPGPAPQAGAAGGSGGGPAPTTAPGTPGQVVGTPKHPSTTEADRGASLVPLSYLGLIAVLAAAAAWYVWHRRRRRG